MSENNNNLVVTALMLAIVISIGGTFMVLSKLSNINPVAKVTGLASTGNVNITIGQNLLLTVNDTYNVIDFGTCTPADSATYLAAPESSVINSSMGQNSINSTTDVSCVDGDAGDTFIRVHNMGNAKVNITVATDTNGTTLFNSNNGRLRFKALGSDCNTAYQWTEVTTQGSQQNFCDDLDYTDGSYWPYADYYVELRVPNDASTNDAESTVELTFYTNTVV